MLVQAWSPRIVQQWTTSDLESIRSIRSGGRFWFQTPRRINFGVGWLQHMNCYPGAADNYLCGERTACRRRRSREVGLKTWDQLEEGLVLCQLSVSHRWAWLLADGELVRGAHKQRRSSPHGRRLSVCHRKRWDAFSDSETEGRYRKTERGKEE